METQGRKILNKLINSKTILKSADAKIKWVSVEKFGH